jgi:hypothetical protein
MILLPMSKQGTVDSSPANERDDERRHREYRQRQTDAVVGNREGVDAGAAAQASAAAEA